MKTIVTGKFAAGEQAARAVDKLLHSCIRGDHVHTFFLNPSTARAAHPVGGRRFESWSVRHDPAIELDVGPASVADGVQVSAYVGTLPEALANAAEDRNIPPHQAGILVAVETTDHVSQALAINVLREHGARGIERATAAWQEEETGLHRVALSSLLEDSAPEEDAPDLRGVTRH